MVVVKGFYNRAVVRFEGSIAEPCYKKNFPPTLSKRCPEQKPLVTYQTQGPVVELLQCRWFLVCRFWGYGYVRVEGSEARLGSEESHVDEGECLSNPRWLQKKILFAVLPGLDVSCLHVT